jgi:DNA polymerase III subunit delta'
VLFSQVVGQEDVKERLRRSFREGRMAHALLILGPEGCGNLALALAFAQYISCEQRSETDACGKCVTCKKLASHQYVDLYFSFPFIRKDDETNSDTYMDVWREKLKASPYLNLESWRSTMDGGNKQVTIPVKEASTIIKRLSLRSYEGGYKFMIIWMADYLKEDTSNKLLKILEEPPEKTIFLLVANSKENMLATILSRVQTIQVPKLPDHSMVEGLMEMGVEQGRAESIAHFADGNWWKALQLTGAGDPNEALATLFQGWMRFCYGRDLKGITGWVDQMNEMTRDDQRQFISYALEQVRQNLLLNYVGDALARMNDSERTFSQKFSPFINDLNAEALMDELNQAHMDIGRNASTKIVLTDLSLRTHLLLRRQPQQN